MTLRPVAILCAARKSVYKYFAGVEIYDIDRDTWSFPGGMPIVAHPPCRAWSAHCAHQSRAPQEEKDLAPHCVDLIRRHGGILEHPAHSRLWQACNLPGPKDGVRDGLWTVQVQQSWWGGVTGKRTWLLVSGLDRLSVPMMPHEVLGDRKRWNKLSKNRRAETTVEFGRWLVECARWSCVEESCDDTH